MIPIALQGAKALVCGSECMEESAHASNEKLSKVLDICK